MTKWRDAAAAESKLKQDAEEASKQRTAMLQAADLENQHLKREVQHTASMVDDLRKSSMESYEAVNGASLILKRLVSRLPSIYNEQVL